MKDLFEHQEQLPKNVVKFINDFQKNVNAGADDYAECEKLIANLRTEGYSIDYGLDGEPFNLQKL